LDLLCEDLPLPPGMAAIAKPLSLDLLVERVTAMLPHQHDHGER
jgi:hypothetical protein